MILSLQLRKIGEENQNKTSYFHLLCVCDSTSCMIKVSILLWSQRISHASVGCLQQGRWKNGILRV